jgi:hypothetical protein
MNLVPAYVSTPDFDHQRLIDSAGRFDVSICNAHQAHGSSVIVLPPHGGEFKVRQSVVRFDRVKMINRNAFGDGANKRFGYQSMQKSLNCFIGGDSQHNDAISIFVQCAVNDVDVSSPSSADGRTAHPSQITHFVEVKPNDWFPNFWRRIRVNHACALLRRMRSARGRERRHFASGLAYFTIQPI